MYASCHLHTIGTLPNPATWDANNQCVGGGGGGGAAAGNAESAAGAAAAASVGGLGFLGRMICFLAFGSGPAGCSSATTGLGSTLIEAAVEKSPGFRVIRAWTVAGRNLFSS